MSARPWCKLSTEIGTNPKIDRAGELGGHAAQLLWLGIIAVHGQLGLAGSIPSKDLRPRALRLRLAALFGGSSEEEIASALQALVDADLLTPPLEDDGDYALSGWDSEWAPQCRRCRKPNEDPTSSTCAACREEESARNRARARKGARDRDDRVEESRREKRRGTGEETAAQSASGRRRAPTRRGGGPRAAAASANGGLVNGAGEDASTRYRTQAYADELAQRGASDEHIRAVTGFDPSPGIPRPATEPKPLAETIAARRAAAPEGDPIYGEELQDPA